MYLSFYNLAIEPFTISADPRFLWLGEKHQEALATLRYGVLANKGFLLLTGDVGTGKTTLINALVESLGKDVIVATVHDPGLEALDFFNFVARAFSINKTFTNKGSFLLYLSRFLKMAYAKGRRVLLVVDEAQRLNSNLLEEIRLLSNIEEAHTKLINIFFVGQNEFNEILLKNENRALRQRISLVHNLEALNEGETEAYIRYRLQVAGSKRDIFEAGAIKEVYSFSGGYPRLINIVCDYALLTGYVKEKKIIGAKVVKECAEELQISLKSYEKEKSLQQPVAGEFRKTVRFLKGEPPFRNIAYGVILMLLFAAGGMFFYRSGPMGLAASMQTYWRQVVGNSEAPDSAADYNRNRPEEEIPEVAAGGQASDDSLKQKQAVSAPQTDDAVLKTEMPSASEPPQRNPGRDGTAMQIAGKAPPAEEVKASSGRTPDPATVKLPLLIFFDYNSSKVTDVSAAKLDKFVKDLNRQAYSKIVIRGYTDGTGQYAYNKKLSELRADSVKRYLEEKGIAPLKAEVYGMGPDGTARFPVSKHEGQLNRRVEIELY